jgi:hypothetical protein
MVFSAFIVVLLIGASYRGDPSADGPAKRSTQTISFAPSLDGASVNLGQHRGVGKLLGDAVPMQVTLHAAAHIVQLCVSDVFELCEYHVFFKELVARLCREYSKSGKRKKNLEELAKHIIGAKALE